MMDLAVAPIEPTRPSVEVLSGAVLDDEQALEIFLGSYSRRSPHTVRSYAKECGRFLLWLRATRPAAPSSAPFSAPALLPTVTVQHINEYLDFLANPRPLSESFLAAQGWRHPPFRKPLSPESVRHCITVLHKMFDALHELRAAGDLPYCMFNPVKLAHKTVAGSAQDDGGAVEEALSMEECEAIWGAIEGLPRDSERDRRHYHRARWVLQLLYRAFLRRDEAAQLKMGSFEASEQGWNIRLVGKGAKKARIVATHKLMEELKVYRTSLGLAALPSPGETRPAIVAVTGQDKGITAQAIYLICKVIFEQAAQRLEAVNAVSAARLRQATPHWMRHTGVTHAMEAGVDPRYVQAQARHSSLNVTARYDHKERKAWRAAIERM